MQTPTALTVAGSDPSGGAGLQADLKAFAATGVHGAAVVTCATSQNTTGVTRADPLALPAIEAQLDAVLADLNVRAVKTGMLHAPAVVDALAHRLSERPLPLVVDPVLVATSGDALAEEGLADALHALAPHAALVTPNRSELEALSGRDVADLDEGEEAAHTLLDRGWQAVLVKGGHFGGPDAVDSLVTKEGTRRSGYPRRSGPFHGAGCTYASLLAGLLARGHALEDAFPEARARMHRAIARAYAVGAGPRVLDTLEAVGVDPPPSAEGLWGARAAGALSSAAWRLAATLPLRLVPEVGINLAYAPGTATDPADVLGLTHRITRSPAGPTAPGPVAWGASGHVARVLLAARHADPDVRCAVNLAYAPDHVAAAERAGLAVGRFSREEEPPTEASSMEWGTTAAFKAAGGRLDVVADEGGLGKEAMLRLVASDLDELVETVERLVAELG